MPRCPIFLIGYMACGKTTLGRALQRAYPDEIEFVDLDELVEMRAGMSVAEIFSHSGEETFRQMEADGVDYLCRLQPSEGRCLVVGCGGGTPCHGINLRRMLGSGTVVWLIADRERTLSRLIEFQAGRPLLAGKSPGELEAYADAGITERRPFYSRAHARFDSSMLETLDEVAASVKRFYSQFIKDNI